MYNNITPHRHILLKPIWIEIVKKQFVKYMDGVE